jgi:NADPH-dependent curcumin reductase CurA
MTDISHINRRITLASYPRGDMRPDDFSMEESATPQPAAGEFLVRNLWVSVDPMLRIRIDARPMRGTLAPLPLGSLIPGAAIGEVVASAHPDYPVGALLEGRFGWQDYALSWGEGVNRIDPEIREPQLALGPLGLPGFSAYVGLQLAGGVKPGQTVVISGAAGAVGSVAGPLARAAGAHVIGIARGEAKRRYLIEELGYHAVIDRSAEPVPDGLARLAPDGVDLYFDNVGGPILLDVARYLKRRGQVLICGLMAHYAGTDSGRSSDYAELLDIIMNRSATIRAFANVEHEDLRPQFYRDVATMIDDGTLSYRMHVMNGLETAPAALMTLFGEGVTGKLVVRV